MSRESYNHRQNELAPVLHGAVGDIVNDSLACSCETCRKCQQHFHLSVVLPLLTKECQLSKQASTTQYRPGNGRLMWLRYALLVRTPVWPLDERVTPSNH